MTRTTPVPLPAPTADELAAVRARIDGRAGAGGARILAAVLVGLTAGGALDGAGIVPDGDGLVLAVPVVTVGFGALAWQADRRARATDRRVAARLGVPVTRQNVLAGVRRLGGLHAGLVVAAALAGAGLLADAVRRGADDPRPAVVAGAVALGAGLALTAVLVARRLADAPVGTGPVMAVVDAALVRADLRAVLGRLAAVVLAGVVAEPEGAGAVAAAVGAVLAIALAVRVAGSRSHHRDLLLLREPRLAEAEPPESWLARGAAA